MVRLSFRNPLTVPYDKLTPREVMRNADGTAANVADWQMANYEVYAYLVTDWHVYDAASEEDDQPLLGLPATGELFARLPLEIQEKVAQEVNRLRNPTKTPATAT